MAAILPHRRTAAGRVYVNGKSHSWIPFGGIHSALGAAPAIVHPAPLDVAIIGLGSGDTAWAAGCRPETRSVTVFEISGPQPRLLRAAGRPREALPDLRAPPGRPARCASSSPTAATRSSATSACYDVIEADALWPDAPYAATCTRWSSSAQCARRLKPGGILCTWAPTPRVYASFTRGVPPRGRPRRRRC